MVGNFIGDFVKGNQFEDYSPDIQSGIKLHRDIDRFTDSHLIVRKSKKRLRDKFHHYAPVIVDIFYDHFLAKNWSKFSAINLKEYTENFYKMIDKYQDLIPQEVNHMLVYMREKNWLYNYQFIEGIDRSLKGMSRRTKFDSKMGEASNSLRTDYAAFEKDFFDFFPHLQDQFMRQ